MIGKNLKMVSYVLFGRGVFEELGDILTERRKETQSYILLVVDDVFRERPLGTRLPIENRDLVIWVNVDEEPTTRYVDELTGKVKEFSERPPGAIIGIGGGSTMDLAKAISVMLKNPGSSAEYQGWDLVTHPAIYHMGIPTLSGTGAEVSRTAVLCGPERKLGINSNYTVFDQILLDPELLDGVSSDQRFYTGMDCYIHCVESLKGTYLNAFSRSLGQKALSLCLEVFLENGKHKDSKLMMGSYLGGLSIAYSQVGICHALSYGLSYILGIHHGIGNCIVFNQLEEFYPDIIPEFHTMMEKSDISLPQKIVMTVEQKNLERMIDVSLTLDPLWENALGPGWKQIMTREKIRSLYLRM